MLIYLYQVIIVIKKLTELQAVVQGIDIKLRMEI